MNKQELQERLGPLHERLGNPQAVVLAVTGGTEQVTGRARFVARFPVRREVGVQPVTVYDETGVVIPSRLVESVLVEDTALPPNRIWWSVVLEFAVTNLGVQETRPYLALYAVSPASRSGDTAFWESLPILSAPVTEHPLTQL